MHYTVCVYGAVGAYACRTGARLNNIIVIVATMADDEYSLLLLCRAYDVCM